MAKKTIFAFSCYLPAKRYGGPLKSIYNLVESTSDDFDYYLISLDHDFQQKEKLEGIKEGWNKVGNANVLYINERDFSFQNILKWMKECKADLVYLCSVYYYAFNFPAVKAANELNIPVLLAPRSDLLPNCIKYKYPKKLAYLTALRFVQKYKDIFYHSTSNEETQSILKWMVTDRKHIVQLPNIASCPLNMERIEKQKDSLRMVYIGRVHPRKNLKYAVECLAKARGKISLDVYGAMEDQGYWEECEFVAQGMDKDKKLSYCGNLSPLEVQMKYYQYDCLLFPTLNENYGHVIVESIISGCPAIISKGTTPWDDYDGNGGFCCELNDRDSFISVIEKLVSMDKKEYQELSNKTLNYAKDKFDNSSLCNEYKNIFMHLMEDKKYDKNFSHKI